MNSFEAKYRTLLLAARQQIARKPGRNCASRGGVGATDRAEDVPGARDEAKAKSRSLTNIRQRRATGFGMTISAGASGGRGPPAAGKLTQGRQGKRKNPHTQHRRMGHPAVQRATRLRGWASVGLRVRYNWWRDSWRGLTWLGGGGIKAGRLGGECLPVLPRGTAERLLRDTGDAGLRGRRVRCESSGDAGLLLGLVLDLYS